MWTISKATVLAAALSVAAQVPAVAQCSMCRTAAAQDSAVASSLNKAILILLIPAVSLFCGVFLLAFRRENPNGKNQPGEPR